MTPRPTLEERAPQVATVYVIERGWHTDIGLPLAEVAGPMAALKAGFPGAGYLVFGFGDRGYVLSRSTDFGDMVAALFPGPGAMLVTGLRAPPSEAFGGDAVVILHVSEAGLKRMSEALWGYFDKADDQPAAIGTGPYLGSVFYASTGTYDALHTCNTWSAEMLEAGGLPVRPFGVVFAGQVMDEARRLALRQAAEGSSDSGLSE